MKKNISFTASANYTVDEDKKRPVSHQQHFKSNSTATTYEMYNNVTRKSGHKIATFKHVN